MKKLKMNLKSSSPEIIEIYNSLKDAFKQKDIKNSMNAVVLLLKNSVLSNDQKILNLLVKINK